MKLTFDFRPVNKINGKGGRNQESVPAAALEPAGTENTLAVSFGTDGTDGLTDAV